MARYVDVAAIRAEGVLSSVTDDVINNRIDTWQMFIERVTRNYFESRNETFILEGDDSSTLHLPIPIVSITSVYLNNSTDVLDSSRYLVFTGNSNYVNQRRNPKIVLKRTFVDDVWYSGSLEHASFKSNYYTTVIGAFGTLENSATPDLIKWALKKLVIRSLDLFASNDASSVYASQLLEEKVDRHRRKFGNRVMDDSWTGDGEVDVILQMYQAPRSVTVV